MLHGRQQECAQIDGLLAGARLGRSGALVLRGEAGIGKSALLDYAAQHADSALVLRGTGLESESEFPFAAVHQLLRPLRKQIDDLPHRQRTALRAAFGLSPVADTDGADRFLVSIGILSLLSDIAEHQPVLCLIDDAQWLDEPSADALAFAARRLQAEGVVLLFGVRDHETTVLVDAGLPELRLSGLDDEAAAALLADGVPVAAHVRDLLVAGTSGNPLGLRELPGSLSADQLAGRAPLPDRLPLGAELERVFLVQVHRQHPDTQTMLLLAAAEQTGDVRVVLGAAELLGIPVAALDSAERAELVRIADDRVVFRHPLVRSAVYRGATFLQRRAANQALAAVLTDPADTDRRAWQLASAAVGPDEALAADLAGVAERALSRGGHAAAATAYERAAALTSAAEPRAGHLLAAARAAWQAGKTDRATGLLDQAGPLTTAAVQHARIDALRGTIEFSCGAPLAAYESLRGASDLLAETDPAAAANMLAEMGLIAWMSGDLEHLTEAGRRLSGLEHASESSSVTAQLVVGLNQFLHGDTAAASQALHGATDSAEQADDPITLAQAAAAALFIGDDTRALSLFARSIARSRADGAVDRLPLVLAPMAALQAWCGQHASAAASATEGLQLARDTGQQNPAAHLRSVLAWVAAAQGREQDCRDAAAAALERAIGHRLGPQAAIASWALAVLDLGMGRPAEAFDRLIALARASPGEGHQVVTIFSAADLVEVAVRTGRRDAGAAAAATLRGWASYVQAPWALALAARCDGLLEPDDADRHFAAAAALHGQSSRPFDAARTELLWGESLRRRRSRAEARTHLRAAYEAFERLGATPWAQRAATELQATGESARKRDPSTISQLTPQELQIARLVGAGGTNREIAAELFLSPRTIDYHLHKIFTKLGITSRSELVRLNASEEMQG